MKSKVINPILIGSYMPIPGPENTNMRKVVQVVDCATHYETLEELEREPKMEIGYTIFVECQECGYRGAARVSSWILMHKEAPIMECKKCEAKILIKDAMMLHRMNTGPNPGEE